MQSLRRQRPLVAWLAVVAIVLGQWFVHGATHASNGDWVEVCSGHELKWVQADPEAPADGSALLLAHCPGCAGHVPLLAPPPANGTDLPRVRGTSGPPPLFLSGPRTLAAWTAAHQRAPPAFS